VYELKATLSEIAPPIWRRLRVPGACTLADLHRVLQIAFGWEDQHLHGFRMGRRSFSPDPDPRFDRDEAEDETRLDALLREKSKLRYEYDFGDSWVHAIVVERITPLEDSDVSHPACITGARCGPPEDCGGPWGYDDMVRAFADPEDPEHEETVEYLGTAFDPELFELDAINRRLKTEFSPRKRERAANARRPQVPAMRMPLSEAEELEVSQLLEETSSFDFSGLLGLFHAVASAPGLVAPSTWMAAVFPEGVGAVDEADAQSKMTLVLRLYNEVVGALAKHMAIVPPALDTPACRSFAHGYVEGASLDSSWSTDAHLWAHVLHFAYLAGHHDLVPELIRTKIEAHPEPEARVCAMLAGFTVAAHTDLGEARRAQSARAPATPSPAKVGRNDACPCGSGKKFKRCCIDARNDVPPTPHG